MAWIVCGCCVISLLWSLFWGSPSPLLVSCPSSSTSALPARTRSALGGSTGADRAKSARGNAHASFTPCLRAASGPIELLTTGFCWLCGCAVATTGCTVRLRRFRRGTAHYSDIGMRYAIKQLWDKFGRARPIWIDDRCGADFDRLWQHFHQNRQVLTKLGQSATYSGPTSPNFYRVWACAGQI